ATRAAERRLLPGLAAPLRAAMPARVRWRAGRGRRNHSADKERPQVSRQAPMPSHRAGDEDSWERMAARSIAAAAIPVPQASRRARRPRFPGSATLVSPARRAGEGSLDSRRTVQAMAKRTAATEIAHPMARLAGLAWSDRWDVPTAGSHQLRRPAI